MSTPGKKFSLHRKKKKGAVPTPLASSEGHRQDTLSSNEGHRQEAEKAPEYQLSKHSSHPKFSQSPGSQKKREHGTHTTKAIDKAEKGNTVSIGEAFKLIRPTASRVKGHGASFTCKVKKILPKDHQLNPRSLVGPVGSWDDLEGNLDLAEDGSFIDVKQQPLRRRSKHSQSTKMVVSGDFDFWARPESESQQRYFRVPTRKIIDDTKVTMVWYLHFDGPNLSRQIEVDQNGNAMLFSANRGLPVSATLDGTGLGDSSKRKFEIIAHEFEGQWNIHGGNDTVISTTSKHKKTPPPRPPAPVLNPSDRKISSEQGHRRQNPKFSRKSRTRRSILLLPEEIRAANQASSSGKTTLSKSGATNMPTRCFCIPTEKTLKHRSEKGYWYGHFENGTLVREMDIFDVQAVLQDHRDQEINAKSMISFHHLTQNGKRYEILPVEFQSAWEAQNSINDKTARAKLQRSESTKDLKNSVQADLRTNYCTDPDPGPSSIDISSNPPQCPPPLPPSDSDSDSDSSDKDSNDLNPVVSKLAAQKFVRSLSRLSTKGSSPNTFSRRNSRDRSIYKKPMPENIAQKRLSELTADSEWVVGESSGQPNIDRTVGNVIRSFKRRPLKRLFEFSDEGAPVLAPPPSFANERKYRNSLKHDLRRSMKKAAMGYIDTLQKQFEHAASKSREGLHARKQHRLSHKSSHRSTKQGKSRRKSRNPNAMKQITTSATVGRSSICIHEGDVEVLELYNLASAYIRKGWYSDALGLLLDALELEETAFGVGHPLVAMCYSNIGTIYGYMNDTDTAMECFELALEIQEHTIGFDHPETCFTCHNIAEVLEGQGLYKKALLFRQRVLSCSERVHNNWHEFVVESRFALAETLWHSGDIDKALAQYVVATTAITMKFGINNRLAKEGLTCIATLSKIQAAMKRRSMYETSI